MEKVAINAMMDTTTLVVGHDIYMFSGIYPIAADSFGVTYRYRIVLKKSNFLGLSRHERA